MLFFYLAVLSIAGYWVIKILGPEMLKPALPKEVKDIKDVSEAKSINFSQTNWPEKKIEKLEILLAEKNSKISFLQKELSVSQAQVNAFEKLKILLDEEIHRLREQNRIFRSELGMPPIASPHANTLK